MKTARFTVLFLAATLPSVVACGKSKSSSTAEPGSAGAKKEETKSGSAASAGPAIELDWPRKSEFAVPGNSKMSGGVTAYKGKYHVGLRYFPKGTKWEAGEFKGVTDSPVLGNAELVDLADKIGDLPAPSLKDAEVDPNLTLMLTLPTGERYTAKLPPVRLASDAHEMFMKIENGPVLFAGESAAPEGDKSALRSILLAKAIRSTLVGRADLVKNIDGIAIARLLTTVKGEKTCGGYVSSGKPSPDIKLQLQETEVTIYRRKSGEVVAKKVFPPDDNCPAFAFARGNDTKKESSIPYKAVEEWLRSQVQQ